MLWLQAHVVEKACVAYQLFSQETKNSYTLSKAALRERFEPTSNREYYKVEFRSRERKSTESWADFGDALLSLVDRAFPDLPDNAREALALDRFLSQLNPLQILFAVRQCKPKCVREAVCATLEAESCLIAYQCGMSRKKWTPLFSPGRAKYIEIFGPRIICSKLAEIFGPPELKFLNYVDPFEIFYPPLIFNVHAKG